MSRWNEEYRRLSPQTRTALNELVNGIFRQQTGFQGKIDPKTQPQLAAKWLEIRDQVLAHRRQFAQWLEGAVSAVADFAKATALYKVLDTVPPWIRIARSQVGIKETPGKQHTPQVMEYIRTCTNIQQTEAQRRYVEREGEEGVEWCSAFVNWCLKQTGIIGTNHALASSWSNWGTALTGPKRGAIVGFSWKGKRIDHVAFCDEEAGQLYMLGGNQTGGGGQVSRVRFPTSSAKFYRWPANA